MMLEPSLWSPVHVVVKEAIPGVVVSVRAAERWWFYREPMKSFLAGGLKLSNLQETWRLWEEENQISHRDSLRPGDWKLRRSGESEPTPPEGRLGTL